MKTLTIILCLALVQCGFSPSWARSVEIPDTPPAYEEGGPDGTDIAAMSAEPAQLAMHYVVPADPDAEIVPARGYRLPVVASAGTGRDAQLGVDLAAASSRAEREGWPWYAWAGVAVGTVVVIGLTAWAIVEASNDGSHDQDSSTHYTIYGDDGSTQNIYIDSPSTSNTRTGY